jgi:ABC-type antimicrobial peptide transport system permease subunit
MGFLMVRTETSPESLTLTVQDQVRAVDADMPVSNIQTMKDSISVSLPRFNFQLLSILGGAALLMTAIGVYGVTSYSVRRRRHEIALRVALGATTGQIIRMILREGVLYGLAGILVGLSGALVLTRLMSHLLFEVSATNVLAFISAPTLLFCVSMFASYIPARRAALAASTSVLRTE